MGTPSTAICRRTDNKLYRLQSGQTPIVRPAVHNDYGMDGFPNGTNAVVAVISYTGYDMEDAMILNKSSHERGFGYGTIYKSIVVDLKDLPGATRSITAPTLHFGLGRLPASAEVRKILDQDGLPSVGTKINPGDPIAGYENDTTGRVKFVKYKGDETGYIDTVRLIGESSARVTARFLTIRKEVTRATSSYRKSRSPFASLGHLWLETSFLLGMGRREFVLRNGRQWTCPSARAASNPTSSSTHMLFRVE